MQGGSWCSVVSTDGAQRLKRKKWCSVVAGVLLCRHILPHRHLGHSHHFQDGPVSLLSTRLSPARRNAEPNISHVSRPPLKLMQSVLITSASQLVLFDQRDHCGMNGMIELRSKFVSCVVVLLSHFVLAMVPRIFPFLSLLAMLPIAALLMVTTYAFAGWFRRLVGITASAPAMVICHILFLLGVHITVVRKGIPNLLDASLNIECVLLLIGLYRIFCSDPGLVSIESTCTCVLGQTDPSEVDLQDKGSPFFLRVRHCNSCKRSVKGFDHHCPAFGNCIGQKNHHQFMVLLIGFIITEATYTISSSQCIQALTTAQRMKFERTLSGHLVISTLLFSFLQVLWQMPFLTWHIYCICCNIKTEEWLFRLTGENILNFNLLLSLSKLAGPQKQGL